MLTPADIRGVCCLVPTPATPDGGSASARSTVAVDALARLLDDRIREGVNSIAMTGTMGEGHTLLWDEHKQVIATAVEVVARRVPLFVGTTALNTREIVDKTRYAAKLGVDGVLNGVPMWIASSWQNAVQCYRDLAEACPDTAIMVYHNPHAFRVIIPAPGWKELAKIPQVIATKQTVTELDHLLAMMDAVGDEVSVLVNDNIACPAMSFGAHGIWSTRAAMGAAPVLRLHEACARGDWERADQIRRDLAPAGYMRGISREEFHMFNASFVKLAIDTALDGAVGPCRPPFVHVPPHVEQAAIECGRAWKELQAKYAADGAAPRA
jgi:hydratase-aldolase